MAEESRLIPDGEVASPILDGNLRTINQAIDGGTLAKRLLGDPLPNVDLLLERLSPPNRTERETPLLEFKASYLPAQGDDASEDACKWNVVEALISMANATGGCVLLGIKETNDHHLEACGCDPLGILRKSGMESKDLIASTRKQLFKKDGTYQFDNTKTFSLNELERLQNCVTFRLCHSEMLDGDVLALIVSPIPEGEPLISVTKSALRNGEKTNTPVLFHRSEAEPRNEHIDISRDLNKYDEFRQNRKVARESYSAFLNPKALLSEQIRASHVALHSRLTRHERMSVVPLSATSCHNEINLGPASLRRIDFDDFFNPDNLLISSEKQSNLVKASEHLQSRNETEPAGPHQNAVPNRQMSSEEIFEATQRICLVGSPGAGKTTIIQHAVLKQIDLLWNAPSELIVYLPLGAWAKDGSLLGLIQRASGLQATPIQELASLGRLRLFLDGLNECPDEFRENAALQISNFLKGYPRCPVTVSSRHIDEVCQFRLPTWSLDNMDRDKMLQFLTLRLGNKKAAQNLLDKLLAKPGVETISSNPMFLDMLVEIVRKTPGADLPTGRAALYKEWAALWQKREERHGLRAGGREKSQTPGHTDSLICRLAFESRLKGFRYVPAEIISEITSDRTAKSHAFDSPFTSWENGELHFNHETFQEYYCAEWLTSHPDEMIRVRDSIPRWTIDRHAYDTWGMPLAFALELLDETPPPPTFLEVAERLDPWFHVAVINGTTATSNTCPQSSYTEPSALKLFSKAILSGLEPEDFPYVFFLLRYDGSYGFKGWYRKSDAPLQYFLSTHLDISLQWKTFETEIFSLLWGSKSEYFVHDFIGSRFVANAICIRLSDVLPHGCNRKEIESCLNNISFAVMCTMLARGFARKEEFPNDFLSRFDLTFRNPSIGEFWLLELAGLSTKEQSESVEQRRSVIVGHIIGKRSYLEISLTAAMGKLSYLEIIRIAVRGDNIISPSDDLFEKIDIPEHPVHPRQIRPESMSDASPSSAMLSFCRKIQDTMGSNHTSQNSHFASTPLEMIISESLDTILSEPTHKLGYSYEGSCSDVFKAWFGGILPWNVLLLLLQRICTEGKANNIGHHYFIEEGWSRMGLPISSALALGVSEIATYLPVRKNTLVQSLHPTIHNAAFCYIAGWLVPCGLAKKEDLLPQVDDWLESASEKDLYNLVADGWIDADTAQKRLAELDASNNQAKP